MTGAETATPNWGAHERRSVAARDSALRSRGVWGHAAYAQRAHCAIARACGFRKINFADKTFADDCETAKKANVFSLERFVGGCVVCNT